MSDTETVAAVAEPTSDNKAAKTPLTKEQRSQIMKDAAKRRWAKAKRAAANGKKPAAAAKGKTAKGKVATKGKKATAPREFTSALKMAEKRMVKAIQERAEAAARYAVLSAEIPSLQQIIMALQSGAAPGYTGKPAFSLEQIVGDQPLGYQNPPRPVPATTPPMQHPVTTQSRAMGGAIGVPIAEEEDENKFLSESTVAGGEWH